jgi:hypothetical protein
MQVSLNTILSERMSNDIFERVVLVQPSTFSLSIVQRYIANSMKQNYGRFVLQKIDIFTDRGEARRYGAGKGRTDLTYYDWRHFFDTHHDIEGAFAEGIAIGSNSVLRFRDFDGTLQRVVLSGTDPLKVNIENHEFEILHIAFWDIRHAKLNVKPDLGARIFMRSRRTLNGKLCEDTFRLFVGRIGIGHITISFREDVWFIESEDFPIVSPFEPKATPPAYADYKRSVTVFCSFYSKAIDMSQCIQFGPYR